MELGTNGNTKKDVYILLLLLFFIYATESDYSVQGYNSKTMHFEDF